MDKNDLIRKYLEYYICETGIAEYAVLIKGAWGSGKTWFIQLFKKSFSETNTNIPLYYISLYGTEKKEEIDEKIFESMHPVLGSKPVKIITNIFRAALKLGVGLKVGDTDISMAPEFTEITLGKSKIEKAVLIFDDIERSSIDIETLLGYFGDILEGTKNKIIILCDEEKVKQKYPDKYLNIKEKVIGQTFEIEDDPEAAIKTFIGNYSELSTKANIYKEILKVYLRLNYRNLRSVKQSIDLFSYLYSVINEKYKSNETLISDLVNVYFTLSLENKAGSLNDISIDDAIKIEFSNNLTISEYKKLDEKEKKKIQDNFIYSYMTQYKKIPLSSFWNEIIIDGKINSEGINENLFKTFYANDEQEVPILYKLIEHWRDLEIDDFKKYYKLLLLEIKDNTKYRQGDIMHYASTCIFFANNKLIKRSKENIILESKRLINKLYNELDDPFINNIFLVSHGGYRGYGYSSEPEIQELWTFLSLANEKYRTRRLEKELLEYFNNPVFESEKFLSDFNHYNNEAKFVNIPVLGSLKSNKFFYEYLKMNSQNKWFFIKELKHRYGNAYSNGVYDKKYDTEKIFLLSLLKIIDNLLYKKSVAYNPRFADLKNIGNEIKGIIDFMSK